MTVDECVSIARGWLDAFADPRASEPALERGGFAAHRAYQGYLESYATGPEEIVLHRRCYAERAKELASRPIPLVGDFNYVSPLLTEHRRLIAASYGLERIQDVRAKYPGQDWRVEVDPLERRRLQQAWTQRPDYDQAWEGVQTAMRFAIESEAKRFPQGKAGSFLLEGRFKAFRDASEDCLTDLGFVPVKTRSQGYVAFQKPIAHGLAIRWSLEDPTMFIHNMLHVLLTPSLSVCRASIKGRLGDGPRGGYIKFPYLKTVVGFEYAYLRCENVQEIFLGVHAHGILVRKAVPFIVDGIKRVFPD